MRERKRLYEGKGKKRCLSIVGVHSEPWLQNFVIKQ